VTVGDTAVNVTVLASETVDNKALSDLAVDVNKALTATSLDGKIAARATGSRIEFYSLVKDNPLTPADESVPFTIACPSARERRSLVWHSASGDFWLASTNVNGEQTLRARSASRSAVTEPVVSEASEIAYTPITLVDHDFAPGTMVYAYDLGSSKIIGSALVLNNDASENVLTLAKVQGTFEGAEKIINAGVTKVADYAGGETVQNGSFGEFELTVTVQPGFDDLGFGDGFAQFVNPGGAGVSSTVTFNLTEFGNPYDPTRPRAAFDNLAGDVGDLYAFKDLDYGDIGNALEGLLALLEDVDVDFALLNTKLPAINRSVSDLLSLVSGFDRGVDNINEAFGAAILSLEPGVDIPALTLQDIPNALRSAFGLPVGVDPDDRRRRGLGPARLRQGREHAFDGPPAA
jgi:hypothetical protein